MLMFGRSFELSDGTIVVPCEYCGNPVWPQQLDLMKASVDSSGDVADLDLLLDAALDNLAASEKHMCPAFYERLQQVVESRGAA